MVMDCQSEMDDRPDMMDVPLTGFVGYFLANLLYADLGMFSVYESYPVRHFSCVINCAYKP